MKLNQGEPQVCNVDVASTNLDAVQSMSCLSCLKTRGSIGLPVAMASLQDPQFRPMRATYMLLACRITETRLSCHCVQDEGGEDLLRGAA